MRQIYGILRGQACQRGSYKLLRERSDYGNRIPSELDPFVEVGTTRIVPRLFSLAWSVR